MGKQVFRTDFRRRWSYFKWILRVVLTILSLLGIVLLTMFALEESPQMPFCHDYRNAVTASSPYTKDNKTAKPYKSFRGFFKRKKMHNNYVKAAIKKQQFTGKADSLTQKYFHEWDGPRVGVRST